MTEQDHPSDSGVTNKIFVSYSSEDQAVAKNLADTLTRYNLDVWFDQYEIEIGDSISGKINEGLSHCNFGVVVLSHSFLGRKWPKAELASLRIVLEEGKLLPVFWEITPQEVTAAYPLLGDIRGEVVSHTNTHPLAAKIAKRVLGHEPTLDGDGRQEYRDQTLSILNLPRTGEETIENVRFERCVLQGPVMFAVHEDVTFLNTRLNSSSVLTAVPASHISVGTLGLRNVDFIECRFKNTGFLVMPRDWQRFNNLVAYKGYKWPPYLQ